jgi:hypothetical protein
MRNFVPHSLGLASLLWLGAASTPAAAADDRVFELRIYYAHPGKLDALHARFRDHTCKLFEKHGMTNVGYWVPLENPENKLVYVLAYPSREAAGKAWKAFLDDPVWKQAYNDSHKDGPLVAKFESVFLRATDYSPAIQPAKGKGDRVFELRTYTSTEGNLGHLNARFRDHTVKLFEKHGMTNIGYWTPTDQDKGADNTLIYFLAHASREAAKESFGAFGKDPDWQAARRASEDKAGGSLTVKGGVKSEFMKATDYSPMK